MPASKRTAQTSNRGLSLLEVFLTLAFFSVVLAVIHEAVIVGLRVSYASDQREELRQQLATALDTLIRDAAVADNVDNADSSRFQFDTPATNNVNYQYSSGTLSRSNVIILRNLTAFDFDFFDSSGTQLAEPVPGASESTVRLVEATATATKGTETVSVAEAVYLRNM